MTSAGEVFAGSVTEASTISASWAPRLYRDGTKLYQLGESGFWRGRHSRDGSIASQNEQVCTMALSLRMQTIQNACKKICTNYSVALVFYLFPYTVLCRNAPYNRTPYKSLAILLLYYQQTLQIAECRTNPSSIVLMNYSCCTFDSSSKV